MRTPGAATAEAPRPPRRPRAGGSTNRISRLPAPRCAADASPPTRNARACTAPDARQPRCSLSPTHPAPVIRMGSQRVLIVTATNLIAQARRRGRPAALPRRVAGDVLRSADTVGPEFTRRGSGGVARLGAGAPEPSWKFGSGGEPMQRQARRLPAVDRLCDPLRGRSALHRVGAPGGQSLVHLGRLRRASPDGPAPDRPRGPAVGGPRGGWRGPLPACLGPGSGRAPVSRSQAGTAPSWEKGPGSNGTNCYRSEHRRKRKRACKRRHSKPSSQYSPTMEL